MKFLNYLFLSGIKILDNVLLTYKSIVTYQHRKVLSSILVTISQLMFYVVIKQVISDNTMLTICLVAASSGIGNYLAFIIADHFKKDDIWQNIITSNDKKMLVELATLIKAHRIKYLLFDTYNRSFDESYTLMVFSKTKDESKLIDNFLENTNAKYLRMIDGEEVVKKNLKNNKGDKN